MAKVKKKKAQTLSTLSTGKRRLFLEAYASSANVLHASRAAGVDRTTHYTWLKTDKDYAAKFQVAQEDALERLEGEALRRAVVGVEEAVYGKLPGMNSGSGQIGTIRKYSDALLIFILKAAHPKKYRENISHEHAGAGGGAVPLTISFAMPEPPWSRQAQIAEPVKSNGKTNGSHS